jgi:hypothetical protein
MSINKILAGILHETKGRVDGETMQAIRNAFAKLPTLQLWLPIETAPKDNAKPLYLARLDADGKLLEIDFDGSWESDRESWEMPAVYYYWASAKGIEEPTHWAYQIGSPPVELIVNDRDNLISLLNEVRENFTRDDDLPNDLLSRIDAAVN